ncbi:MAG: protease modulator HflC [Alphaproteobacteria bacterium]
MTRGRFLAIGGAILAAVLLIVGFQAFYIVDPTRYALVLRFGEPVDTALEPGLYFKLPFIDNVQYVERRIISFSPPPQSRLQEENEIVAGDQTRINVLAFGRYRVTDPLEFYRTVRTIEVANSRLLAILDAAVRRILGEAPFQDIIRDDRARLMEEITALVAADAALEIGVEVIDVRIQRIDLPEDNADRIYERMQTERQQEAALIRAEGDEAARRIRAAADREVTVTVANADRDGQILRGAGDAEANRLYAEAYGVDVGFFEFFRSMEAYIQALDGNNTTLILSPTSDFFRYFNQVGAIDVPPTPLDPELLPEVPIPEAIELPNLLVEPEGEAVPAAEPEAAAPAEGEAVAPAP